MPSLRSTVRGMMVATATLAVAFSFFLGIAHLVVYRDNIEAERFLRETAANLEAKDDVPAQEVRKLAEEVDRSIEDGKSQLTTFACLAAVGVLSTGLGVWLRRRNQSGDSPRSELIKSVVAFCLIVTKVLVAGLVLAALAYIGVLLLVLTGDD